MEWVLVPVIAVIEIFLVIAHRIFAEKTLHSRNRPAVNQVIGWGMFFCIFNYITYFTTDSAFIHLLVYFGVLLGVIRYLYDSEIRYCVYLVVFLFGLGVFSEILTYCIVPAKSLKGSSDYNTFIVMIFISKVIWFGMIKIALLFVNRYKIRQTTLGDWVEACLVPTGSILIAYTMFPDNHLSMVKIDWTGLGGYIISIALILINLGTYYLYEKSKEVVEKKMRAEALEKQCNYYMRQCEESQALWTEMGKFRHDMKQKYIYFKTLLETGNYDELRKSYDEDMQFIERKREVFKSGNPFVDSILNYKAVVAERYGIKFRIKTMIPCDSKLDGEEISICLGNLIDNAIEGARTVEGEEKEIFIRIKVDKCNLFMEIENPYCGERVREKGKYRTTKRGDRHLHGMGLQIIKEIVDRHNGEMRVTDEDGIFRVRILLFQVID